MKRTLTLLLALVLLLSLVVLGGCGKEEKKIVMYDGEYAECWITHRMMKELIEYHTDVEVELKDQMGVSPIFIDMVNAGTSDIFMNYDGTAISTQLGYDVSDVPEGQSTYDFVAEKMESEFGPKMMGKLGFNNTYVMAVMPETAEQYSLTNCSSLVPCAGELTFGAEADFVDGEASDRLPAFCDAYGIEFGSATSLDVTLKYVGISEGNFQVTEVYATDAGVAQYGLVLLNDDLAFFPDYYAGFTVKGDLFERYPELEEVCHMLDGLISNEAMAALNYEVDVEGRDPGDVAHDWLVEQGLVK